MQIVISISEESYKTIKEQVDKRDYPDMQTGRAIANGTPLPKEHGSEGKQATATWYTPEEKMPKEDERVPVVISGHDGNTRFDHALQIGSWMDDGLGWLVEGLSDDAQFVVDAWCDLELPE